MRRFCFGKYCRIVVACIGFFQTNILSLVVSAVTSKIVTALLFCEILSYLCRDECFLIIILGDQDAVSNKTDAAFLFCKNLVFPCIYKGIVGGMVFQKLVFSEWKRR